MRKLAIALFVALLILLYGALNYYIGNFGWQLFSSLIPGINSTIYWISFWLISFSYFAARMGRRYLPQKMTYVLTLAGSYWLGAMFYFLLAIPIFRILFYLATRWVPNLNEAMLGYLENSGLLVVLVVVGLLIGGTQRATRSKVTKYDIHISKEVKDFDQLHLVMVSDLHLGELVNKKRLEEMVRKINELKPDLVLMAGDIVDDDVIPFFRENMAQSLSMLDVTYGVYAVPGNHEYISGKINDIAKALSEVNIQMLRDGSVLIKESLYIVGRDDLASGRFGHDRRQELETLLKDLDDSLPIILLDHQPSNLSEAEKKGVDLQLSGHTHRGQLAPNHFITKLMYENDWGYLKRGTLHTIVSSGYGTWGPPIRVGNPSEIVSVTITFKD